MKRSLRSPIKELMDIFSYYEKIKALTSITALGKGRYALNFDCWGKCESVEFDLGNQFKVIAVDSPQEETCFRMVVKRL